MQSQIQNVSEVMSALEQNKPLTGTLLTLAPDFVRAFADPESLDAQQKVEEVVQRSLRVTLGAQFNSVPVDGLFCSRADITSPTFCICDCISARPPLTHSR